MPGPTPESYYRLQLMTERSGMSPTDGLLTPLVGVGNGTDEVGLAHSLKSVSQTDPKSMTSFGLITSEVVDRSKEVVLGDGIDWSDFDRNPIGLFQHNRMAPICKYVDPNGRSTIERRGKEIYGRAYYLQSGPPQLVQMAEQVFQLVEAKVLNGKSLGFLSHWKDHKRVPDDVNDPYAGGTTYIQKCRPFEISDVFFPDNPRALVTEVVRKGIGGKKLCLPIFKSLAPLADPEVAWSMGWGGPELTTKEIPSVSQTPPGTTQEPASDGKRCSVCKKEMGSGESGETCKACAKIKALEEENTALKAAAAQHKSLNINADRLSFFEKHVSDKVGLPLSDYSGKTSQKAMKAMYDGAMFLATNALASLDDVEGEAEKALREFITYTVHSAGGIAEKYKEQFSHEIPGATPPDVILDACRNPDVKDPVVKAMADACMSWTVHYKGWRKAHTDRTKSASELLAQIANSTAAPDDATRRKAMVISKNLAEMVSENGSLVVVEDLEVAEIVKSLQETVAKLEAEVANNKKIINRAKAGLVV